MPVAGNRQPYGLLHGGASAVLAESLGSTLAALHALPERFPVGLELPAPTTGRPPTAGHRGGPAAAHRAQHLDLRDRRQRRAGRRVCTAKLTCLHRDTRPEGW
jgi:hypothetical protein